MSTNNLTVMAQKNVEDTKKAEMAADYSACDADKLLWHFSFGANMDPEVPVPVPVPCALCLCLCSL